MARIWDIGASKGMTKIDGAAGEETTGPKTRVQTGAVVFSTRRWFKETLPVGTMLHVELESTANTISAGQANAEKGVETSWLAPAEVPSSHPGE